jgi:hypothetical protein
MWAPDSNDRFRMAAGRLHRLLHLQIGRIGGRVSVHHPAADDVEEREDPNPRSFDDELLELSEVLPSGAAAIDHRSHAVAQCVVIGIDVAPIRPRIALTVDALRVHIRMQVYETGGHVIGADIDRRLRLMRREIGRDADDAIADDGDVEAPLAIAGGIENVPVLEQQIVNRNGRLGLRAWRGQTARGKGGCEQWAPGVIHATHHRTRALLPTASQSANARPSRSYTTSPARIVRTLTMRRLARRFFSQAS